MSDACAATGGSIGKKVDPAGSIPSPVGDAGPGEMGCGWPGSYGCGCTGGGTG